MLDLSVADLEAILCNVHLIVTASAPKRIRDAAISCRCRNCAIDLTDSLTSTCSAHVLGPRQSCSQVTHAFAPSITTSYIDSFSSSSFTSLSLANNSLTASHIPFITPLLTSPSTPLLGLDLTGNPCLSAATIANLLPACPSLTRLRLTCPHNNSPAPATALAEALRSLRSLCHVGLTVANVGEANVLLDALAELPIAHLGLTTPFVDMAARDEPAVLELPELLSDLSNLTMLDISDRGECVGQVRGPGAGPGAAAGSGDARVDAVAEGAAAELELEELERFMWALLAALPSVRGLQSLCVRVRHGAVLRAPAVRSCYCVLLSLFHLTELVLPGCDRDRIMPVLLRMPVLRAVDISDNPHDNCAAQAAVLQRRRMTLRQALAADAEAGAAGRTPAAAPDDSALGLTRLTQLSRLACTRVHCESVLPPPRRPHTPPSPLPAHPMVQSASVPGAMPVPQPVRALQFDGASTDSARSSPRFGLLSAALSSSFNGSCVNTISADAAHGAAVAPTSLERRCSALASLRSLSLCESSCGLLVETAIPHPPRAFTPGNSCALSCPIRSACSEPSGTPSCTDSDFEMGSESDATPAMSGRSTLSGGLDGDEGDGVCALAEVFLHPLYQLTRLELCHVRRVRSLLCGLARFAPELRELELACSSSAAERAERFDAVPPSSRALRGALRPLCGLTAVVLRSATAALVPALLRTVAGAPALRRLELTVCCEEGEEWDGSGFVDDLHGAAEYAFRRLSSLEELTVGHRDFAGGDRFLTEMMRPVAVGRLSMLRALRVGLRGLPPSEWCRDLWHAVKALPMQGGVQLSAAPRG